MKKSRTLAIGIIIYVFQLFIMITLSRYTHNKSLYTYFVFSFIFNLLLHSMENKQSHYMLSIIILNILFAITAYFFGNKNMLMSKNILFAIQNILFNTAILFVAAGNWMLPFLLKNK